MARPPAAATWIPLLALLLVGVLSLSVTHAVPDRPGARLLAAVEAFCSAISAGEVDAALDHLAPQSRTRRTRTRVARVSADRRGSIWLVVRVDPASGTTAVVWGQALSDKERTPEVLQWTSQADGTWKLVL